MEKLQLQVSNRNVNNSVKSVRKSGSIPGVVYGNKLPSCSVSFPLNEFEKIYRKAGESTILELQFEDGGKKNVLIHDLQRNPVTYSPIHVDFLEVSLTEKLTANVALEFIGESMAIKAHGGTLVKLLSEIEVECLPSDLPHLIQVDISPLNTFEDLLKVENLTLPKGVKAVNDPSEVVAKVQAPRDLASELAKEVGDVSQVEGIKEVEVSPENTK